MPRGHAGTGIPVSLGQLRAQEIWLRYRMCLPKGQMWRCNVQMWLCILGGLKLPVRKVRALWLCLGCYGICLLTIGATPPRTSSPRSAASFLPAGWGAAFFPLSFSERCPLRLSKRSKSGLLAPDWRSLNTHTQHVRLQIPVSQRASPIFSKQSTSPTWPPTLICNLPPGKKHNACKPRVPLETHPPLSPQPRPLPDTLNPGPPRSFSRLAQEAQQLPSALRPPLPKRGLDLSQPAHPALVGRGPRTRRRRGICSRPPPQPRPHGRRGRAPGGWKGGGLAAPRPARDARDGQCRVYGCAPKHWPPAWSPGSLLFGRGFVVEGPARVRPGVGALPGSSQGGRCGGQGGIWHLSIMWPQSGLTWGGKSSSVCTKSASGG